MRGYRLAAAVTVMALLVVLAPVALASHTQLVVESQHTDFGTGGESNPDTLENVSVAGSGDSASVMFTESYDVSGAVFNQSFDYSGQDTQSFGIALNDDGTKLYLGGDDTDNIFEYDLSTAYDLSSASFSQSLDISSEDAVPAGVEFNDDGTKMYMAGAANENISEYDLSTAYDIGSASFNQALDISGDTIAPQDVDWNTDGTKLFVIEDAGGSEAVLEYDVSSAYDVSTASLSASFGISSEGGSFSDLAFNDKGDRMYATERDNSKIYMYRLGTAFDVTTASLESSFNVSNQDADPGGLAWKPDGSKVFVGGNQNDDIYSYDVGFESGKYISANHTVDSAEQAKFNVTAANVTIDAAVDEWTGSSWQQVGNTTVSTTGNHTLDISSASNSKLRSVVEFQNEAGGTTAQLHDESILFEARSPSIDNASATPTGGLSSDTTTLEIDVNDSDFATSQGDTVTVEFFVDGASEGTDTLTSNGTASVTTSSLTGGDHTWNATATDDYGLSHESQDFTISIPDTLVIREESPPHGKIMSATVEATFFEDEDDDPVILNRTTSDGEINLTGLPVGSEFSVSIHAPGYNNRTVILEDIFTQNNVFLINKNETTVENRFVVADRSGNFQPENTEIIVQTHVNQSLYDSGGFEWLNAGGDDLGADQAYTTDLIEEKRYRLVAQNEEGDKRVLGAYTAETGGDIQLEIGSISLEVPDDETTHAAEAVFNSSSENVEFEYVDPASNTGDITLKIYERGNESNTAHDQTHSGPFGTLRVVQPVDAENVTSWVVEYETTRNGESVTGSFVVGQQQFVDPGLSDFWRAFIGAAALVIVAGLFGGLRSQLGVVVLPLLAGGLWFIGWLPGTVGAGAIILALGLGVLYLTSSDQGVPGR